MKKALRLILTTGSAKEGQYKSKTSDLKIGLKIEWTPSKINLKKNTLRLLGTKLFILEPNMAISKRFFSQALKNS